MARVPYIREDKQPELADLIATLRGARRGRLLTLYRLLLRLVEVVLDALVSAERVAAFCRLVRPRGGGLRRLVRVGTHSARA